jgi:hypothetical protein
MNPILLPFVFAFAELFEDGESGFFGVGDGQRLEFVRGAKGGDNFAHRFFARRTPGQLRRGQWASEREMASTGLALAFSQLIFIKRHGIIFRFDSKKSNEFLAAGHFEISLTVAMLG